MDMRRPSRIMSMARWFGRRAASAASATTRSSFPTDSRRLSAKWSPRPSMRSRTGRGHSGNSSMPSCEPDFGIYVHWPFCKAKCPYCDFNSHVRHGGVDAIAFADALATELAWFAGKTPGREVASIFFGGDTPSLMPPGAVARVIETISRQWKVASDMEVTLEGNPTIAESRNFAAYRAAGVNRVSVGVQSLDDDALKALGRQHSASEAVAAFRLAARLFPRVSFDLIYARPGHTAAAWRDELERAIGEQQGHM